MLTPTADAPTKKPDSSKHRSAGLAAPHEASTSRAMLRRRSARPTFPIMNVSFSLLVAVLCFSRLLLGTEVVVIALNSTDPSFYYDLHKTDKSNGTLHVGRVGNVDVVRTADGTTEIGLLHLVGMYAFSEWSEGKLVPRESDTYMHMAASMMGARHFNTGDGSVVSELEGIDGRCNIKLTTEFHDSQSDMYVTLKAITDVVTREEVEGDATAVILPGAIIGAYRSEVTGPSATLSGVHDLVQMSFTSTGTSLSNPYQYPLFARAVPSDEASASVAVRHLTEHNGARHVAVIFVNDKYGNDYDADFKKQALMVHPPMIVQSFSLEADPTFSAIKAVVELAKATGYRYFFAIVHLRHYERLMTEAVSRGIAGSPEYSWLFATDYLQSYLDGRSYEVGSPLALATRGIGILIERGGHPGFAGYDNFLRAWREMDGETVEYVNSKVPSPPPASVQGQEQIRYFTAPGPEFFRETDPAISAPFAYDTVVTMGLAACNATATGGDDGEYFSGREHHRAVKGVVFSGASGTVRIDNDTSSRVPTSAFYSLFNAVADNGGGGGEATYSARDTAGGGGGGDNVTFSVRESISLRPNENGTSWDFVEKEPFLFADGTPVPPAELRPFNVNHHYIGKMRYFGYIACSIILAMSLFFAIWSYVNRGVRVVKASQPPFLIMICTGTFIMGSSIIPMGIDDEFSSERGCDMACMAVPWLTTIGFVTAFSALFSKTWRINKIFNNPSRFKRIKVTASDVILPFVGLMTANVTVLICWTVLAPIEWERIDAIGTDRFNRTLSTYSVCMSTTERRGGATPYVVLLAVINGGTVVMANVQAYRARNVKVEFSESKYIAIIMASLLQAWLLGIPLLVLVFDIPEADYIIKSFLIFVTTMAILLFIFVPKMIFVKEWKKERAKKNAAIVARQERRSTPTRPTTTTPPPDHVHIGGEDDGASGLKIAVVDSVIDYDRVVLPYGEARRPAHQKVVMEQ